MRLSDQPFWLLLALLAGSSACLEPVKPGATLTGEPVKVIGHAGSGFFSIDNYLPANSETSIRQAVDILGVDGVEVDVQLSADSVLILYHDHYLEQQTDCSGCVYDHSSEDLASCRFRSNFAVNIGLDDRLWTLEALLADFAARPQAPLVNLDPNTPSDCASDFSPEEYFRTLARRISTLVRRYDAEDWVYVELSELEELDFIQQIHPELQLVWLGPVDQQRLEIANARQFWGVITENEWIDKTLVEEAHRRGLGVMVYNVKIRQGMVEAVEKGVDMIETDNIPLLWEVLEGE